MRHRSQLYASMGSGGIYKRRLHATCCEFMLFGRTSRDAKE